MQFSQSELICLQIRHVPPPNGTGIFKNCHYLLGFLQLPILVPTLAIHAHEPLLIMKLIRDAHSNTTKVAELIGKRY